MIKHCFMCNGRYDKSMHDLAGVAIGICYLCVIVLAIAVIWR